MQAESLGETLVPRDTGMVHKMGATASAAAISVLACYRVVDKCLVKQYNKYSFILEECRVRHSSRLAEWPNAWDCKSLGPNGSTGSNPVPSAKSPFKRVFIGFLEGAFWVFPPTRLD